MSLTYVNKYECTVRGYVESNKTRRTLNKVIIINLHFYAHLDLEFALAFNGRGP